MLASDGKAIFYEYIKAKMSNSIYSHKIKPDVM